MLTGLKNIKGKKGQALVEMALILPILLLLVFGMIDFGRILQTNLAATEASREIARVAALLGTDATAATTIATVQKNATAGITSGNTVDVTITPASGARTSGTEVKVVVATKVDLITPLINTMLTDPFPVSASTTMRAE